MAKKFRKELNKRAKQAEKSKEEAIRRREEAEQEVRDAKASQKEAEAEAKAVAKAQKKLDKADELTRSAMQDVYGEDCDTQNVTSENGKSKGDGTGRGLIAGLLIGAIATTGIAFVITRESKKGEVVDSNSRNLPTGQMTPTPTPTDSSNKTVTTNNNGIVVLPTANPNEFVVVASGDEYEELTTDKFTEVVAGYAKTYEDKKVSVSTADITKFASIVNIDRLAEDNRELLAELAQNQAKEEYLNDAAKVIGATVMHNFTVWNETNSTEKFIRVSDVVFGEQKELMIKIEEYMDSIAEAVNADDEELVNSLVSEFITDLNSGSLSKLDDGVGFGAQVNIAVIADGIARNYLNSENFNKFQILKTSEKYVSNIFTVYERCTEDVKTLSK